MTIFVLLGSVNFLIFFSVILLELIKASIMASLSVKVYFTGLKLRARAGGAGGLGALLDVYLVKGEDDDAGL